MAGDWERQKARALLAIGRLLTQFGEDAFAIEMLQKVVGLRPELIEGHVELGIVYGKIEDYRKMVETLREAIRLDRQAVRAAACKYPEDTDLLDEIIYAGEGGPEGTYQMPEMPADLQEAVALSDLAEHYMASGDDKAAVAALERSLALSNASFLIFVQLVVSYLLLEAHAGTSALMLENSALKEITPELISILSNK